MPSIDETIELIQAAHSGQTDKAGRPYYLHPIAVMRRLPANADTEVRLAALLHDVLEDTAYSRGDLAALGYSKRTLDVVMLLTQRPGDPRPYTEKIDALIASGNRDAMQVKLADISENADPQRLAMLGPDMRKQLEGKYTEPKKALMAALGLA